MEKLKLKSIPHSNQYRVSWLKRGQQVILTKQCLLSFQIGKFSEKVLCDIIEMDACDVLIKRPWLFDIKNFYYGMNNTYEFLNHGQRYRLEPMVET